jgi:hypothetical protein
VIDSPSPGVLEQASFSESAVSLVREEPSRAQSAFAAASGFGEKEASGKVIPLRAGGAALEPAAGSFSIFVLFRELAECASTASDSGAAIFKTGPAEVLRTGAMPALEIADGNASVSFAAPPDCVVPCLDRGEEPAAESEAGGEAFWVDFVSMDPASAELVSAPDSCLPEPSVPPPREASTAAQLERKLSEVAAAVREEPAATALAHPARCALPSAAPEAASWIRAAFPPAPISLPVDGIMEGIHADAVPKE